MQRERVVITGRVQGVGFRPAVAKLARGLHLTGWVRNDGGGVTLELQGPSESIALCLERLTGPERPPLARVETCRQESRPLAAAETDFEIVASAAAGAGLAEVTVDTAVCLDCLREMRDPQDPRHRYAFINCTHCGPRYTIVRSRPYDRPRTTMAGFAMCPRCRAQYEDPTDRRYHAQPVACPVCGPRIWLTDAAGQTLEAAPEACLRQATRLLHAGRILAVKGLGGFHLAVDAGNEEAVLRLRRRKQRDHKPFALMARDAETVARLAVVTPAARALLESSASPVVLLPRRAEASLSSAVAGKLDTLGFMLCYTPLHHLLFTEGPEVLVMTSANLSDEPLICENEEALARLAPIADAFILHDREIYRRADDSIVQCVGERAVLIRRARGYMPGPIRMHRAVSEPILAVGADLKNTFCLARDDQLICSEHIGDLADARVYAHYRRSIDHLRRLFEVEPAVVAYDLHPGYVSTQYALQQPDLRRVAVQHHWAHVAAVLAEYRREGPIIGLVADGTGYGPDGAIWGGECLIASVKDFRRVGALRYFRLPGGDAAGREAVRPLMGLLREAFGPDLPSAATDLLRSLEPDAARRDVIARQLERGINCVPTSSVGRLFDATAGLLGVGTCNHYDAELPMGLEALARDVPVDPYPWEMVERPAGLRLLDWRPWIRALVADVVAGLDRSHVATRFHVTLAAALCDWARHARQVSGIETVALAGGCFCNRRLCGALCERLEAAGFEVLLGRELPPNDGAISVGQAIVAARADG